MFACVHVCGWVIIMYGYVCICVGVDVCFVHAEAGVHGCNGMFWYAVHV